MRLLRANGDGGFSLVEYVGKDIPTYAILSHTWGPDRDELTFRDISEGIGQDKVGYRKLQLCSQWAAKDDIEFFWIDTCCIDKSSSAELSEAINSMFKWYFQSLKCYVYLPDVSTVRAWGTSNEFSRSRWFTRGWTLQELVAPKAVEFFCRDGKLLGDRVSLMEQISQITSIPVAVLEGGALNTFEVEERLSWAVGRNTKREEDAAYSLLGLFDIHMPLLYGEGKERALARLRKEIDNARAVSTKANAPDADISQLNAALRRAAETGNISIARRSLDRGADIHSTDFSMRTPLHTACLVGTSRVIKLLLEHGARLDDMDLALVQPLHLAASRGDREVLQTLLSHDQNATKTEINVVDGDGNTPLHRALISGHIDSVNLLLRNGADVYKPNKAGQTSLRVSRHLKRSDVVRAVHRYRREDIASTEDEKELIRAAERGDLDRVESYLDSKALGNSSALCFAAKGGHVEVVEALVSLTPDVDATSPEGMTALEVAVCSEKVDDGVRVMELLLRNGAEVRSHTLLRAVRRNRPPMVQLLLNHGAGINWRSRFYRAAIEEAIDADRFNLVQLLVQAGANVEREVFSKAMAKGQFDKVNMILKLGVKPDSNIGLSAAIAGSQVETLKMLLLEHRIRATSSDIRYAIAIGRCDVLDLLIQHGPPTQEWVHDCENDISRLATDGKTEIMRVLLKDEAPNFLRGKKFGSNLLGLSVANGHSGIVRLLLEHGAYPSASWEGANYNLLSNAAANDNLQLVVLLLEYKADVNSQGENYVLPLQAAAARGGTHSEEIAELLLDRQAWIDGTSMGCRKSPLALAVENGNENMVRFLLERGASPKSPVRYYHPIKIAESLHASDPEKYTRIMDLLRNKEGKGIRQNAASQSGKKRGWGSLFGNS